MIHFSELIRCDCGKIVTKNIYLKHYKTKIHQKKLRNLPQGRPIKGKWKTKW